jgi:uncharacterized membrane protein
MGFLISSGFMFIFASFALNNAYLLRGKLGTVESTFILFSTLSAGAGLIFVSVSCLGLIVSFITLVAVGGSLVALLLRRAAARKVSK